MKKQDGLKLIVLTAVVFMIAFFIAGCSGAGSENGSPPSSDANLAFLGVTAEGGTVSLSPSFNQNTIVYTVNAPNSVSSITVDAVKVHAGATVNYSPAQPVNLEPDAPQTITITVSAQDGETQKIYVVTVTRALSGGGTSSNAYLSALTVSEGTLTPSFSFAEQTYTLDLPYSVSSLTVNAIPSNEDATITPSPSQTVSLPVGTKSITVTVTAEDSTTKSYTISVTRASPAPSVILINNENDLENIGTAGYPLNAEYLLKNNLTLTNWMPIGAAQGLPFTGTFDGNGKTITLSSFDSAAEAINATVNFGGGAQTVSSLGLFWYTNGASIRNLNIITQITTPMVLTLLPDLRAGGIAGIALNTAFSHITVGGSLKFEKADGRLYVGGITGQSSTGSQISDCISSAGIRAETNNSFVQAGGISGAVTSGSSITGSGASGNITAVTTANADVHARAGGIAGLTDGGVSISDCYTTGAIEAIAADSKANAGGIVGHCLQTMLGSPGNTTITRCFSTGTVSASANATSTDLAARSGGIANITIDYSLGNIIISQCYSTGNISAENVFGPAYAGGITGEMGNKQSNSITIDRCYATGNVEADSPTGSDGAGGIAGNVYTSGFNNTLFIRYCAALNKEINASDSYRRIIAAYDGTQSLNNNIAYSGMKLNGGTVAPGDGDTQSGYNGASKSKAELTTSADTTFRSIFSGFDSTWHWVSGYPYPVFLWQNSAPAYTPLP